MTQADHVYNGHLFITLSLVFAVDCFTSINFSSYLVFGGEMLVVDHWGATYL